MDKLPPTTEELFNQTSTNPDHSFSGGREALAPYTPEELARLEIDRERAANEEIARRAATTRYLAEKKRQEQAAAQLAKVIPIAYAPSYHTRKIEQAQQAKARATPQEW